MQPQLLLLDEPTSQLDPIAAGEFFNTLKRINSELGTTVIITEHRLENLFPMVDRVVFMRSGSIVSNCSPADAAEKLRVMMSFSAFCLPPFAFLQKHAKTGKIFAAHRLKFAVPVITF